MADLSPIPAPEPEQPEASSSSEVKSKHGAKKMASIPVQESQLDRQPVFLVMTSGQIESAEV